MSVIERPPDRALELATQVGEEIKSRVPDRALKWVETGAAIGVVRSGAKVATRFVRRNPVIAVAAVAGAGLLWYAARRRAQQAEDGAIEGQSRRVAAKRANGSVEKPRAHPREHVRQRALSGAIRARRAIRSRSAHHRPAVLVTTRRRRGRRGFAAPATAPVRWTGPRLGPVHQAHERLEQIALPPGGDAGSAILDHDPPVAGRARRAESSTTLPGAYFIALPSRFSPTWRSTSGSIATFASSPGADDSRRMPRLSNCSS